jgi:PPP family 3-phenylpropionic acid transporter
MGGASYTSFIGLYYASIDLNNSQIGFVSAIAPVVSLAAQPFWGTLADRSKTKNSVLQICLLLTSISVLLIPLSGRHYYPLVAAVALFGFVSSFGPIGDSVALELSKKVGFKFTHVRTAGSLGFALMSFAAAKILTIDIRLLFVIFCLMRLSALVITFYLPKIEGHDSGKKDSEKKSMFLVFEDRRLAVFLAFIFLVSCTAAFFNSFHSIYSRAQGVPMELLGFGIMIGSFSQFPFMLGFDRIYLRFGIVKLLAFSGFVYSLRWFLYLFVNIHAVFILIWVLHGMTFILLYLCISHYVHDTVRPELRTRGQAMNHIMLYSASALFGSSVGGLIASHAGLRMTFGLCGVFCLVVTAGFIAAAALLPSFKKHREYSRRKKTAGEEVLAQEAD